MEAAGNAVRRGGDRVRTLRSETAERAEGFGQEGRRSGVGAVAAHV